MGDWANSVNRQRSKTQNAHLSQPRRTELLRIRTGRSRLLSHAESVADILHEQDQVEWVGGGLLATLG